MNQSIRDQFISDQSIAFEFNYTQVAYRELYGLGVLMRKSNLFEVEKVGLDIVNALYIKPHSLVDLSNLISTKYMIPPNIALADMLDFIIELVIRKIIKLLNSVGNTFINEAETYHKLALQNSNQHPPTTLKCWTYAREKQIPLKCKLNLTYRCNIACRYCYNGERPGTPGNYSKAEELNLSELEALFTELQQAGTFFISFSGGEPFARRDFPQILNLTTTYGFAVEILSNGTYITQELAKLISKNRLQIIIVPIFGISPKTHDNFVRIPGSFNRACAGIKFLLDAGIEVGVRCSINSSNFHEWQEVRSFVKSLGARYLPHVQVHLSSDRAVDQRHLRLSDPQLRQLFTNGLILNPEYSCEVGFARVDIMPNGDVALCSLLTDSVGNIRENKFSAIWRNSLELNALREKLNGKVSSCSGCDKRGDEAYRCSADALFDDGALSKPSSEALRIISAEKNNIYVMEYDGKLKHNS